MGTTGAVTIDLNNISDTILNATQIVEKTTEGIANQGALIGLAIGLTLAIGLLFILIFSILAIIPRLLKSVKGLRG